MICGHSGEARNLAEAALHRGFDDVRIVTWPIDRLERDRSAAEAARRRAALQRGHHRRAPGSRSATTRFPTGATWPGIIGRLVELFTDGVPTVAMSLYLSPHSHRRRRRRPRGARPPVCPVNVTTIAEAVGSDVTNVVRVLRRGGPVRRGRPRAVVATWSTTSPVAVSDYTRELIIAVGRRDRRPARHPLRRPVPRAGHHLLPGHQHGRLPGPRPGRSTERARAARPDAPTATCCSSPGSPTPRASTT